MIRLDSKRLLAATAAVSLMLSSTACSTLAKRTKEAVC